ncbi:MAG TPA: ABC transporter ATP-binding protein [Dongiaceae bacterium]|nr:ABC transporter ATP-binding protein [Dongiaceae bacterium]
MSVTLANVSRTVGGLAHIRNVSLELERGSINVLLGPTLSGKTSLMRLLAGLDAPTEGRVLVNGKDVTGAHVRSRSVAMVYQQFINYPTLTVFENIASPLRVRRRRRAEIEARVHEAARLLKLEPFLDRLPLELSGGQQQRTAIARALVKDAELVLLDEPLANLDYKLREELREELPRVFEGSGAIFVYATTEPSEALLLGGKTACLREGELVQFGPTIEVYNQPRSLYAAQVFSDPPLNTALISLAGGQVEFASGEEMPARALLSSLADGRYTLAFRAHQLSLGAAVSDAAYRFAAKVLVSEITGSESFVHVACANTEWVAVVSGVHDLAPDAPLVVGVDPARVFVFDSAGRLVAAPAHGSM